MVRTVNSDDMAAPWAMATTHSTSKNEETRFFATPGSRLVFPPSTSRFVASSTTQGGGAEESGE